MCAAINHVAERVKGRTLSSLVADWGKTWRHLVNDSQLRWIGPDKGAMHLAVGAVVNAVWDLLAKEAGKPLWRYVAEMSPAELVRCIDFRYLTDVLGPDERSAAKQALRSATVDVLVVGGGVVGCGAAQARTNTRSSRSRAVQRHGGLVLPASALESGLPLKLRELTRLCV